MTFDSEEKKNELMYAVVVYHTFNHILGSGKQQAYSTIGCAVLEESARAAARLSFLLELVLLFTIKN